MEDNMQIQTTQAYHSVVSLEFINCLIAVGRRNGAGGKSIVLVAFVGIGEAHD